jgi:predicted transcriptional regulator
MSEATRITPELASAARALLGWSRSDLAQHVHVSERMIGKYENGLSASHLNLGSLRSTFESAGVEFIAENGGGAGVRLRRSRFCPPTRSGFD